MNFAEFEFVHCSPVFVFVFFFVLNDYHTSLKFRRNTDISLKYPRNFTTEYEIPSESLRRRKIGQTNFRECEAGFGEISPVCETACHKLLLFYNCLVCKQHKESCNNYKAGNASANEFPFHYGSFLFIAAGSSQHVHVDSQGKVS